MLRKIFNRIKKYPFHGLNFLLAPFGLEVTPRGLIRDRALALDKLQRLAVLISAGGNELLPDLATELVRESRSQLGQDLFALATSRMKQGGYFVEVGATNGVALSNTYLLETKYKWDGILAEPGRVWHSSLEKNRKTNISRDAVWSSSGKNLAFSQTEMPEYSTLTPYNKIDSHAQDRVISTDYMVKSISLRDLLGHFEAPGFIDFLSIDTEGSELEILSAFDFSSYTFGSICVEHNFTSQRQKIFQLLSSVGYRRVLQHFSQFDDWYVRSDSFADCPAS